MNTFLIYVTTRDGDEARRIGKGLVQARLAACVNIFDRMHSIYEWNGALQEDHEAVMIAKTVADKVDVVIETIRQCHSYEVPCVLVLPVTGGNPAFLDWIARQVDVHPGNE